MKKSNKLLLGGFLTVILMITGLHIAIYAKYKNGSYTIYHRHREEIKKDEGMQSFPDVKFITIRDVPMASVYFSRYAEAEKGREALIQIIQKGDSLVIIGQPDGKSPDGRARGMVTIILPENATLFVVNSYIHFQGEAHPLSIVTDSISRFSVQSKHLLKTTITTIPNNP
jgi:hypothetical protein